MNLKQLKPRKALNKAFLRLKPNRSQIETFKANLTQLLDRINDQESEEFHKNLVTDFLKKTYYEPNHFINTKGRTDLVIHNGPIASSTVGVIVETKKPTNRPEMLTRDNINVKAFQEMLLYYLRERITHKNLEIRYLIATNIYEWFIFDANIFEKHFAHSKSLVKQFVDFEEGRLSGKTTEFFYKEIAEPYIESIPHEIEFTYFDIRDYEKPLRNTDKQGDNMLIALFKLLSPEHLLKLPFANDSNTLDKRFYGELLHIIGLTEIKDGSKKIIERNREGQRNSGSLLENAIVQLDSLDKISRLEKPTQFGGNHQERLFSVALELSITWINRILFLKLLEAQLITYQRGDKAARQAGGLYSFLNLEKIKNFDDLNSLFFQVLARKLEDRDSEVRVAFEKVPYLNSSLFEPTDLEHTTLFISNLRDEKQLPIYSATVLKDNKGRKRTGTLSTLEYLFEFLNAYDFASEGSEEIQEDNKTLINASVLGLIFEKINGYKDGSFFTPGFITMYMCRETIRKAVVQKFNETKGWQCQTLDELYNRIEDRHEANQIVNSLKICDPAVGSGHFLVSALNEIIAVKNDLNILQDRDGKRLKEYHVEVENDELIVTDEEGVIFEYYPKSPESQRVQEALFHEKQTIIENCLFGVDINPNSVKICRLRLWIELLKNAYYKSPPLEKGSGGELETLPNIDINIKCGNSLISRYSLDADLSKALRSSKWTIDSYRLAIATYRNAQSKEQKREMERLILTIKQDFTSEIRKNDPLKTRLDKLANELYNRFTGNFLFEPESSYGGKNKDLDRKRKQAQEKLEKEIATLTQKIEEIKGNKIFENAFEWRFEFPEVLNENGDFVGFDVVIGNPPYFSLSKIKEHYKYFELAGYKTLSKVSDIYCLFYERGNQILKADGFLTYITSNSWLRAIYGDLLKNYFIGHMRPLSLLNIEDIQVFDEATVESSIITLQKSIGKPTFPVVNMGSDYAHGSSLSEYFSRNSFEFKIPLTSEWLISDETTGKLKLKVEANSKLLKDFNITINRGFLTGLNEAFIIDEETRNQLISEDPRSGDILKPILRGRDLKKYSYAFPNLWMICTFPSLKIEIKSYPSILNFFTNKIGRNRLEQSGEKGSRKKTSNKWYETQDAIAYWRDFEKPKIVWGEISDKPKFAYDDSGFYAEATTFIMTGEKLKYLLAILNSKLSEWYFLQIGTTTGMGTNRWKKYKIELLPIKVVSSEVENQLERLVNKIIDKKSENPSSDTSSIEDEIDTIVYSLYNLTADEISVIEATVK